MSFEHTFDENLIATTIGTIEMPKEGLTAAWTMGGCHTFGCMSIDC